MSSKALKGFKALPLKFTSTSSSHHQLFIKEHSVRNSESDKPKGRTLFVINVPPYATEDSFRALFTCAGIIENVFLHSKLGSSKGFKTAYVVFEKESGLEKALKLNKLPPLSTPEQPIKVGLNKWADEYNQSICDHSELQLKVNTFMAKYDEEELEKSKQKNVDEDGWTVVTKKGRNPGLARKESLENKIMEKMKMKAKRKELKNFYTFQIRESKKKHIEELRKKYEADKNKIDILKQTRKFKPF